MPFGLTDLTRRFKKSMVVRRRRAAHGTTADDGRPTHANTDCEDEERPTHGDAQYQYGYLPPASTSGCDYIRTLVLLPGAGDSELRCELHTAILGDTDFEAVSYVWGNPIKDHEIHCEGRIIRITANLWSVLQRVRSIKPRVLWADSICINQDDLAEKGRQVALMGRVYRAASRVLIFLGAEDFGHGANVCSLLEETRKIISAGLEKAARKPGGFPKAGGDMPVVRDSNLWTSFDAMLELEWFTRGWVVQEAAIGRDTLVIWGEFEFSWEDVLQVHLWSTTKAYNVVNYRHVPNLDCHQMLYKHYHESISLSLQGGISPYSFLDVLKRAKRLQFSDPRDRLFGLAELARDFERHVPVRADYSISVLESYREFVSEYIRSIKDTRILDFVCHEESSLYGAIPSWITRWDIADSVRLERTRRDAVLKPRGRDIPEPVIVDGGNTLRVLGVFHDTVLWCSDELSDNTSEESAMARLIVEAWAHIKALDIDSPYPADGKIYAFMDALAWGKTKAYWESHASRRRAFQRYVIAGDANSDDGTFSSHGDHTASRLRLFLYSVLSVCHGTKLILTHRGFMGLAPRATRPGDHCAVVFGCAASCVLRKYDDGGKYKILGPSIIISNDPYKGTKDGHHHFKRLGKDGQRDWEDWGAKEELIELC